VNRVIPDEPMWHISFLKRVMPHAAVPSLVRLRQVRPVRPPDLLAPALAPLPADWQPEVPVGAGVRHSRKGTQRLGNAIRARGTVRVLFNQASTLLREQLRAIALALLPIEVACSSIVILTDTLRQRGAARVEA
jgi:hypothetical protein